MMPPPKGENKIIQVAFNFTKVPQSNYMYNGFANFHEPTAYQKTTRFKITIFDIALYIQSDPNAPPALMMPPPKGENKIIQVVFNFTKVPQSNYMYNGLATFHEPTAY